MAQAVAAIAGGLLSSTANSKGETNGGGGLTANNSIVSNPQQNAPEIKQTNVEKAADPVETKEEPKRETGGKDWQQLAQMAQGLISSAQGSAPMVSGGSPVANNQAVANFR